MSKFNFKKWIVENKYGKQPSYSNYGSLNEQSPNLRKIRWRGCTTGNGPNQLYCVPAELGEVGSTLTITQNFGQGNTINVYVQNSYEGCQNNTGFEHPAGQIVGAGTLEFDYAPYDGGCPENSFSTDGDGVSTEPTGSIPPTEPTGSIPPTEPTGSFTGSIGGMPSGTIGKPVGGGNKFPLKRRDRKKPRRIPTRGLRGLREIKEIIKKEIKKLKK